MFCKLLEHHRSGEHGSPRVSGSTSAPDPRSASDQTQSTADAPHRHDEPALPPTAFPHPTPRPRAPPCSSRSPSLAPPPRSRPAHTPEPPPQPTNFSVSPKRVGGRTTVGSPGGNPKLIPA